MSETTLARPNGNGDFDWATLKAIVTAGDLGKLTEEQQTQYYLWRCEAAGLDPKGHPFQLIELGRKLVLYATKAATDQLCDKRRLTVSIVDKATADDLYIVTARAADPTGRYTEDIGAVAVAGLRGEALANALMKAVTKAKRRAVLSLCGLGTMDESEVPDVGTPVQVNPATGEVMEPEALPAETETQALKRTTGHLFAAAAEAGINTDEIERMRRLCGAVLVREVEQVRTLDPADRATVGYWVQANPADAYLLAHPEGAEEAAQKIRDRLRAEAAVDEPETRAVAEAAVAEADAQRRLRLEREAAVQSAERGPYAQQMGI